MIKRIVFGPDDRVRESVAAPPHARPLRVVLCTSLPEVLPDPVTDRLGIQWFEDPDHLHRFERWQSDGAGVALVADELVLRGGDWLDGRWRDGGERLKHMAIAKRAEGLTQAEFSARWKDRAGRLGRAGGAVVTIPDRARGCAYVQNHPRPEASTCPYDALNEVYFDDLESLQFRIEWFARHLQGDAEADLVGRSWFVAAREDVLWAD